MSPTSSNRIWVTLLPDQEWIFISVGLTTLDFHECMHQISFDTWFALLWKFHQMESSSFNRIYCPYQENRRFQNNCRRCKGKDGLSSWRRQDVSAVHLETKGISKTISLQISCCSLLLNCCNFRHELCLLPFSPCKLKATKIADSDKSNQLDEGIFSKTVLQNITIRTSSPWLLQLTSLSVAHGTELLEWRRSSLEEHQY